MWPFSGKSEDEYYRQPQQEESSFLGNIGSMLWTGVKAAFYALLAVVTLGTIFKIESVRNFVDGFTGGDGKGDGKGFASWVTGLFDKGTKAVGEFFTPTPKDEKPVVTSISATKSEKIGEADVLIPAAELTKSLINQNPNLFVPLSDINGTRKSLSAAMVSTADSKAGNEALDQTRIQSRAYIQGVSEWNSAVISKGKETVAGAPQAPLIPISIPDVGQNERLNDFGARKFPNTWKESTPLQKFTMLEHELGVSSDFIKRPADLPAPNRSLHIPKLKNEMDVNDAVRDQGTNVPFTQITVTIGDAKVEAKKANAAISRLVDEGRFSEASLVADTVIKRLQINGSKLDGSEKAKGQEHLNAINSLMKSKEYTEKLDLRREFDPIAGEMHEAGRKAAILAPQYISKYEGDVDAYRKKVEFDKLKDQNPAGTEPTGHGLPDTAKDEKKTAQGQGK